MANNAKRSGKSGKFTANPNSKAQRLKRQREQERLAALGQTPIADTAQSPPNTAKPSDDTGTDEPSKAKPDTAEEPSHVDSYFPEPAEQTVLSGELLDSDDDDDAGKENDEKTDKPRPSRAKRARAKMLAEQLVKGTDGVLGIYVGARHGKWLKMTIMHLENNGQSEQADMLRRLESLSDTERTVLIESIARYIEENNIELSPGTELAILMGSMYLGRAMALETALFAAKKAGL